MEILNTANAVILDTETTGLGSDAEIVEIALIDATTLQTLYTSLVKPTSTIPAAPKTSTAFLTTWLTTLHRLMRSGQTFLISWLAAKFLSTTLTTIRV